MLDIKLKYILIISLPPSGGQNDYYWRAFCRRLAGIPDSGRQHSAIVVGKRSQQSLPGDLYQLSLAADFILILLFKKHWLGSNATTDTQRSYSPSPTTTLSCATFVRSFARSRHCQHFEPHAGWRNQPTNRPTDRPTDRRIEAEVQPQYHWEVSLSLHYRYDSELHCPKIFNVKH